MRAVVCTKYGSPDVLQIKEVAKPVPQANEVLVRVRASTVTSGEVRMRRASRKTMPLWPISRLAIGFWKPKRPFMGTEFAGEVEAVGQDVTLFKKGDQVFGMAGFGAGANAEYLCLPEGKLVAVKSANITYEEAAAIPFGGLCSLYFLRDLGKIQSGQKVLIYGASGALGTAAVQLAKHFGAHVTGVCSTANVDLVKSLGADHVIDYTKEDFTKRRETYDLIYVTIGKPSFARSRRVLNEKGTYVVAVFGVLELLQMLWTSKFGSKRVLLGIAKVRKADVIFINELLEAGKLVPVIDRRYPLEQIAAAHEYVERGHKKGSVVITVAHHDAPVQ